MMSRRADVESAAWRDKSILITGICGTVGRELLRQLVAAGAGEIVGLDNNESALFYMNELHRADDRLRFYLGDVRDRDALTDRMRGVDTVLHTAALKHVGLSEYSPSEAIATNIHGVQYVIEAARVNDVGRVLFTSTDKAVNPTNVMGTSKLMGERLITAASAAQRSGPIFASTRFGNVLGSAGSVIPLFRRQIAAGGPVTVTHPGMTRFIMTVEEAVRLVTESVFLSHGGEVFVTKMPVVRIADLADVMIRELAPRYGYGTDDIAIENIGVRPGEKMYEELLNDEEVRRTIELERYFVVLPPFSPIDPSVDSRYPGVRALQKPQAYTSLGERSMSRDEICDYLERSGLFSEGADG